MSNYPSIHPTKWLTIVAIVTGVSIAAPVNWLTQERSVSVHSPWASEGVTSPDFSPFRASVALAGPLPDPGGIALATQSSELLTEPEGFFAGLTAEAGDSFLATSDCRIRFSVSEPREFTLYNDASASPDGNYWTILWRGGEYPSSGQAVAIIWNYDLPPPWPNPVRVDGILQPDVYEFIASTQAGGYYARATLSSWLLIPEPPTFSLMLGALLLAARSMTHR